MSSDTDPGEQAQISASDFAQMCDEMKRLKERNAELETKSASAPKDDGGPAFPVAFDVNPDGNQSGMRLRDYFAAAALQGWLATYGEDTPHPGLDETNGKAYMKSLAQCSYEMADAMLAARKEESK